MLAQRVVTALVLLPLLLAAIWFLPSPVLYAVFCGVGLLAAWEWTALMGLGAPSRRAAYVLAAGATLAAAWLLQRLPHGPAALAAVSLAWWLYALLFLMPGFPQNLERRPLAVTPLGAIGLLILPATLLSLALLHAQADGPLRLLFMLFAVFAADIGAYLVGRNFGRHKLAPRISPGKSIEGAVGGLGLAALWAAAAGPMAFSLESPRQLALLVAICLVTAAVSIVGDLTESLFKRVRGLKDSGHLLPGHGGILDRIDSILAAAPTFYLGVVLFRL